MAGRFRFFVRNQPRLLFNNGTNRTKQKKLYTRSKIQREDIAKLFPMLNGREEELDLLYHIAQTPQALRGVVNLFSNAYDNEDYSYEGLVAMAKYMDMEV